MERTLFAREERPAMIVWSLQEILSDKTTSSTPYDSCHSCFVSFHSFFIWVEWIEMKNCEDTTMRNFYLGKRMKLKVLCSVFYLPYSTYTSILKKSTATSVFCPWPTSCLYFEGTRYIQTSVEGSTPSHYLFLIYWAFTVFRKVICLFKP